MKQCNGCPGYYCQRQKGSVLLVDANDLKRLARHFGISEEEVRRRYLENRYTFKVKEDGSCIFQSSDRKSRHCTVHQARPAHCGGSISGNG